MKTTATNADYFIARAHLRVCALFILSAALAFSQVNILTHHNDNTRSGANLSETILNTSNVNANQFGMLFSVSVDAQIYAQPLYVAGVTIPGKGVHNVVYVATENNSVYAFDADLGGTALWQVNLGSAANCAYGCTSGNMYPLTGITATPVINASTGTMYVVNLVVGATNLVQAHYLHALDITSGAEKFGGPVRITATYPGTGEGGTTLTYTEIHERLRPALTLVNGMVVIGTASYDDWAPFHGWVFAYNASTLQQVSVWNSTPNGTDGSMWQAGAGFVVDDSNNIYFMTGNGTFDGVSDFGSSVVKLSTASGLTVADYFTPSNEATLTQNDIDLGASGPLRIPGTNYLVGGGKEGKLFLMNMSNLGKFNAAGDQVLQEFQATTPPAGDTGHIHCVPSYYSGPLGPMLYIWGENDHLKAFSFSGSLFQTTPVSEGTATSPALPSPPGMPGGCTSLSASGTTTGTGIVWASTPYQGDASGNTVPGILRAYDASNLTNELWDSKQNVARDDFGNFAKYVPPIVTNGKVYLATFSNKLAVYGLLPLAVSAAPTVQTITAGSPTTFSVAVGGSAKAPVTMSVPAGTSATFTPPSLLPPGVSTLNVSSSTATPPNNYPIVVSASNGTQTASTTVYVAITSFSLAATPASQSVISGNQISYTVTITALNGFTGSVALNVSGLPAGAVATFSPATIAAAGSSTLTITTGTTTPSGSYPFTITGTSGALTSTAAVTLVTTELNTVRVNCGGPAYTDSNGNLWAADTGSTGGTAYTTVSAITGTANPSLFQTMRFGTSFGYTFAVANGSYILNLNFAEPSNQLLGGRTMNVSANGQSLLTNFDTVAQANGGQKAVTREFPITVTNGQIALQFTGVIGYAIVNAIEILPQTGVTVTLAPASTILTASQTAQFTPAIAGSTNTAVTWTLTPPIGSISATGLYTPPTGFFTSRSFTVTATSAADPTRSASVPVTLTPSTSGTVPISVRVGGVPYTDSSNGLWSGDTGFSGGATFNTTAPITNTANQPLYQDGRTGTFSYAFVVPNGSYTVVFKFAVPTGTPVGGVVFNVTVNGQAVLSNFDAVAAAAGATGTALDETFTVAVTTGQIAIQFTPVTRTAFVDAIQIHQ
jgi:hypothetical protein